MRHIHADVIHAWAEGASIQYRANDGTWWDIARPQFKYSMEYRIKPEKKPDVVMTLFIDKNGGPWVDRQGTANLKVTVDGETGKLKSAEVLE